MQQRDFENDIQAYHIGKQKYTIDDLDEVEIKTFKVNVYVCNYYATA
jgi:hypothetical protein